MSEHLVQLVHPNELKSDVFGSILPLVGGGGEVATAHLVEHLCRAHLIAMKFDAGQLASVGAIKALRPAYIQSISRHSSYRLFEKHCIGEFGYVVTAQEFRGRGFARQVSATLLNYFAGRLYATSRVDNLAMHNVLSHNGFEVVGRSWRSVQHPTSTIGLWLRRPSAEIPQHPNAG